MSVDSESVKSYIYCSNFWIKSVTDYSEYCSEFFLQDFLECGLAILHPFIFGILDCM